MPVTDDTGAGLSPAAARQRELWGVDPEGWALFSEPHTAPLFRAVLDAARVGAGTRLLDVGCGAGLLLRLAAERGAVPSGLDVSPGLLGVAAGRLPDADLRLADLQALPFPDGAFDAVTAVNALQFAADPAAAIAEIARVLAPGGRVGVGMFAEPERAESTAVHAAMARLSPPEHDADHRPYALSESRSLERALADAGLTPAGAGEVECVWAYDRVDDAVRGLIGSAGGVRAVQDAGREAVVVAIHGALAPFTDPATGRIAMRNVFRWVSAEKGADG